MTQNAQTTEGEDDVDRECVSSHVLLIAQAPETQSRSTVAFNLSGTLSVLQTTI